RYGLAMSRTPSTGARTYVLDTSVLLSDPAAFHRFAEHEVILPLVVISEVEDKRHHPELGWFARQALRLLDDLRLRHGRLDRPVPPAGFATDSNDARILATAFGVAKDGRDVTLVTKDMPLRVKAAAVGLRAEEYRHGQATDPTWTGMAELALSAEQVDQLYADGTIDLDEAAGLPVHTGLVLQSRRGSALGRVRPDKSVKLVRGDREAFGLRGRSAEQRVALDLLLDDEVGIVSLGGRAG